METDETFTHDELIGVLLEAQNVGAEDDGIMTGAELEEAMGVGNTVMLRRVKQQIKAGTIEVGKTKRTNVLGILTTVRGYRLKA